MPPRCHWFSAPSLSQLQVLVLCSWRWGRWRGWQIVPWRHWATALQKLHWALPCQLKPVSQSGTLSLWPSSSQVYLQSDCNQMQHMNKVWLKKCYVLHDSVCNDVVDSRCDLRLQKDQNEDKQGRDTACKHHPHWERFMLSKRVD